MAAFNSFCITIKADNEYIKNNVYFEYQISQKGYCFERMTEETKTGYNTGNWKRISEKRYISAWETKNNY